MLAFSPFPINMATTQEEQYSLYTFSGLPTHASTYQAVQYPLQQPDSSFNSYNIEQSTITEAPSNYILESQSSSKYAKHSVQLSTPLYSPTNTSANYFDLQPIRSVKSESAASMLSSSRGSPLMGLESSSSWTPVHGVGSGVFHQGQYDHQILVNDTFNYAALSLPEKAGCVGKPCILSSRHRQYPDLNFTDPTLIQPLSPTPPATTQMHSDSKRLFPHPPSPTPSSVHSNKSSGVLRTSSMRSNRPTSPYIPSQSWNPYPTSSSRRQSISSAHSHHSRHSQSSLDSEENKGVCPIASCGRHIKDLKAHLLTHKNERPEKCPITSCEYHVKGFARKYDKNRHTLTHYKGTMVCGFCPGSGSSSEKSFNRADVFKRHLTSVHGVEQTAPNARRRSGGSSSSKNVHNKIGITGMCSTCGVAFANVQDFYEHLDDCVLRVIQQGDPCEAINERILSSMIDDKAVRDTLERHSLSNASNLTGLPVFDDDEEDDDDEGNSIKDETGSPVFANSNNRDATRQGMTYSKGGVSIHSGIKNNKRRKDYPPSWNAPPEKMKMKKRVLCVFDGPRRLWKDDLMLGIDNQVREPLSGKHWVTSLDVQTLRRAEGILEATEEEKGSWLDEQGNPFLLTTAV
ncbi:unnamed protein product [Aureobasidium mustum]|uniref:C2H2-type domain-containing protein n=1 Tax=Aureobasidium mustum TaxID=2773714 RepID=A0A9N8PED1_9PEZI|nr:unnamed protein product [Aureobasidium mustum]